MGDDEIGEMLAAEAEAGEEHRDAAAGYVRSRTRPRREPAQVYSLRIPVQRLTELREVAEKHGVEPSVLMRQWVLDRLDAERDATSTETVRAKLERARRLLEEVREAEERRR
jgi:aryl-alcohol dehydrogenase-like predicted oxidoreductase